MRPLEAELTSCQKAILPRLRHRLQELDYNQAAVLEALQWSDFGTANLTDIPRLEWLTRRQPTPLRQLAGLWLGRLGLERKKLEKLLDPEVIQVCVDLGLLMERGPQLRARVDLYPIGETLICTDPLLAGVPSGEGFVYYLGGDSLCLARTTPRQSVESALDLCTGSGVHAVLAGFHSQQVVGVDLNPRALAYSRFNAVLNERDTICRFVQGDLYQPVEGQTFDLITANPPFVPTPDRSMAIHRTGGESGEEISARLVGGLPRFLRPGGTFAMILDYPVMSTSTYLERLETWLGEKNGWGIAVLDFDRMPLRRYIPLHLPQGLEWPELCAAYRSYLKSYSRLKIEAVHFGLVLIRRLPQHHPGWQLVTTFPQDPVHRNGEVSEWLTGLEEVFQPGLEAYRLRPGVRLLADEQGGVVRRDYWPYQVELEAHELPPASRSNEPGFSKLAEGNFVGPAL